MYNGKLYKQYIYLIRSILFKFSDDYDVYFPEIGLKKTTRTRHRFVYHCAYQHSILK